MFDSDGLDGFDGGCAIRSILNETETVPPLPNRLVPVGPSVNVAVRGRVPSARCGTVWSCETTSVHDWPCTLNDRPGQFLVPPLVADVDMSAVPCDVDEPSTARINPRTRTTDSLREASCEITC